MFRARPILHQRGLVLWGYVSFVRRELVLRKPLVQLDHEAVSAHFGQHRGRGHTRGDPIPLDQRQPWRPQPADAEPVDKRVGRLDDELRQGPTHSAEVGLVQAELVYLEKRVGVIYTAITLSVFCALLICLLIALAFVDAFVPLDFGRVIAIFFVLAMVALIGALACFLREIFLGVNTERCPVF